MSSTNAAPLITMISISEYIQRYVDPSILQYHSDVMQSLVPERSYSFWGRETRKERRYRRSIENLEVRMVFREIDWIGDGKVSRVEGETGAREDEGEISPLMERAVRGGGVGKRKRKAEREEVSKVEGKGKRRKISEGSRGWMEGSKFARM